MKKIFLLLSIGILVLSFTAVLGYSQSADDVIAKMMEALGGKEKLINTVDTTTTGTMTMPQVNLSGTISIYMKAPNKMRMDLEIMGTKISQFTDGEKVWMINPQTGGTAEEMPEKFAKLLMKQAYSDDAWLNPEKYGIKYTLKGKEKVNDVECFVLERESADGDKSLSYVDAKTYLTIKVKGKSYDREGKEIDSETFRSDFKEVDGRMIAHTSLTFQNGQEYLKMTFDKVTCNTGIADSIFKPEVTPEVRH